MRGEVSVKQENDYFYVRQIDPQGRLVLPKEIRDRMGIVVGTPLKLSIEGTSVVMKIASPSCFICGKTETLLELKEKRICKECLEKLNIIKRIQDE